MNTKSIHRLVGGAVLALACGLSLAAPALALELDPAQQRGKQLYRDGVSAAGRDVFARIGSGNLRLPATTAPCGSCHGEDGRGRPEGGVVPSDITWDNLSKSYGGSSASGRQYPPYDLAGLSRLLTEGVDPGGNRLESLMPRYEIAAEDVADLVAYLKVIDRDLDPGIEEGTLRIGTLLPLSGEGKVFGETLQQVVQGYFDDINEQGGVFNRELELVVADAGASRAQLREGFETLFADRPPFAMLAAYAPGHEELLRDEIEARKVPAVGPFSRGFADGEGSLDYGFYLFGDMDTQGRALAHYARLRNSLSRPAVVFATTGRYPEVAAAVERQTETYGWTLLKREYAPGRLDPEFPAQLNEAGVDTVFFVGPAGDLQEFLNAAAGRQWMPSVLALGTLSGRGILKSPPGFADRLFLAYPTAPADQTPEGMQRFREFYARHKLPRSLIPAQIATYAATATLIEGIKRAGRDLSRGKLVAELESLYEFNTGLTPKLSFHANRHVGAPGAHIVPVDLARGRFSSKTVWIEPE